MIKNFMLLCFAVLLSLLVSPKAEALMSQSCSYSLAEPTGIALNVSNNTVWVASFSGNSVTELSLANCTLIRGVATGINPLGVVLDNSGQVWVANYGSNSVTKINASTGAVICTIGVGTNPRGITFDGSAIWVANYGSNTVTRINYNGCAALATYNVGSGPYFLAFNPTDGYIYVPNRNSNTVTVLRPSDGVTVRTVSVDSEPQFVATGTGSAWVSCYGGNGMVDQILTSGARGLTVMSPHSGPTGISLASGFVYGVTNSGYAYRINSSTGFVDDITFRGGSSHAHYDGQVQGTGAFFWVTDFGGGLVVKLLP